MNQLSAQMEIYSCKCLYQEKEFMNLRYFLNTTEEEKKQATKGKRGEMFIIKKTRSTNPKYEKNFSINFYFYKDKELKGKLTKKFEQALHKRYPKVNELMKKW